MATLSPLTVGADPMTLKWNVVRGDTAILRVEFYETDESTVYNTSSWKYAATAYDYAADVTDTLSVVAGDGYAEITAASAVTQLWGQGAGSKISELAFDLQVTINNSEVWTPVVGTISVIGDVTGANL